MNRLATAAIAALSLLAAAAPAFAEDLAFSVVNNSSLYVDYFYASPSNTGYWGDDLLGTGNRLSPYSDGTATIADGSDQCLYDFKYVMSDGQEYYEESVDLCSLGTYTIYE